MSRNCVRIVGILLLKDEDIFVEKVIKNIVDFCDEIIVADHKSTDNTADIVRGLQTKFKKILYYSVNHPSQSHDLIKGFANKPVWIFAVDGDELYDPNGLIVLRSKIQQGEYNDSWLLFGNVLHCIELNVVDGTARGYLSPPCRSMTKLYNFSRIQSWEGDCPERLHGGEIVFNEGAHALQRLELYKEISWGDSFFRCLHLCFLRRSSDEKEDNQIKGLVIRKNISDKNSEGAIQKIFSMGTALLGSAKNSAWKHEKYMRGELVEKKITSFGL